MNVINVEHLARQRGIELVQVHEPAPPAGLVGDVGGIRIEGTDGASHRILGTAYADGLPRVLRIDGYNMDMVPEGNMVLIVNKDQPGVIGTVGTSFGDANVNIANMAVSRITEGGKALMAFSIDTPAPPDLVERVMAFGFDDPRFITLA